MKKLLENIISSESIRTVFQPIISLVDGSILGYEALSRGPEGSTLERPDDLFKAAEDNELELELEYLCRIKALERGKKILPAKMLFINVDPNIMHHEKFKSGFTKDFMLKSNIDPTCIIFEITEKTCIHDYKMFRKLIDNYISQGYKIAIDDTGAGYSGLRTLAETHPQYIKLDMDMIRDIDKKIINQALVKALADFADKTNIKIIAEGIETIDELNTLIYLGIEYGQGYLLQKPSPEFLEITPYVKNLIISKQRQKESVYYQMPNTMPIGEIARFDRPIEPEATGSVVNEIFNNNTSIQGIPVCENGIPIGLIMRNQFYAHLATQYGNAVFMNRAIRLLMNKYPLVVDYNTSIAQVSNNAVNRREENLYDYIIISKDEKYYGVTTIKNLLECTSKLELNKAKHSNPLTGLPGNIIIEERIKQAVNECEDCYIIHFDLDNFKAYNDVYGFENGDKILAETAIIIQECLDFDNINNFLGHIGGDDFVAVVNSDNIKTLCNNIIKKFDSEVKNYYTEYDRSNGYIITKNRHGVLEKFPIISISIAVVDNSNKKFISTIEMGEKLSVAKKRCKLDWQSCYIIENDENVIL